MTRTVLLILACAAAQAAGASPLAAQVSAEPWFRGGTFMFTVEAGGAAFSDFYRTQARPVDTEPGASDFRRRVSAHTSGTLGASASYWLSHTFGVRGGMAWVPSGFTVWTEDPAVELPSGFPEADYAALDVWLAHATLLIKSPRSFGRVVPYAIAGGGLVRYSRKDDASIPPEAEAELADGVWQTPAAVLGLGATIPLQRRNLLLSFELTDHITRARSPAGPTDTFEMAGQEMEIDRAAAPADRVSTTSHVRLSFGLTLPVR